MSRGSSKAMQDAEEYEKSHPGQLTGAQIAKKFGLERSTVYSSEWWKQRKVTAQRKKRPPSSALRDAENYQKKHPGQLSGDQLAKKFGVHPTTIYRADWWRNRIKPEAKPADQAQ